jgi:hypothetical protein
LELKVESPSDALKALRGFYFQEKEMKGEKLYSLKDLFRQ